MGNKTVQFYGGPFHERDLEINAPGGILPGKVEMPVPTTTAVFKRYNQKFAHYRLAHFQQDPKRKFGYFFYGYSQDRVTLSKLPGAV